MNTEFRKSVSTPREAAPDKRTIGEHPRAAQGAFIYVRDELAPSDVHRGVWEACAAPRWYFGHTSRASSNAPFWRLDLEGDRATARLWEVAKPICEDKLGRRLEVVHQYANGHTFGLGGDIHRDAEVVDACTLLYYPMLEWRGEWQGETIYRDARGNVISAVRPVPNRAVLFDARIRHAARAPSRFYGGLRVTVAFKLAVR